MGDVFNFVTNKQKINNEKTTNHWNGHFVGRI
jgi:hypothetical protein